jgi:hypothetical protein
MKRGIALAAGQVLLLVCVAGKALWDRDRLPHAWARAQGSTGEAALRGRYARLHIETQVEGDMPAQWVTLQARDGRLMAEPAGRFTGLRLMKQDGRVWLAREVAVYVPEHTVLPDLGKGQELWLEVAVPRRGPPRPVRLGRRTSGGQFAPYGPE